MKSLTWLSACAVAGTLAAGPLRAQSAATPPDARAVLASQSVGASGEVGLRAALDSAWQRALAARESDARRRRADADRAIADSAWAAPPSLLLGHRDDRLQGNAGKRESGLGVSVPLWLPGQRAARADSADAAGMQAQAAERAARLRLAGELREAAWDIAAIQAEAAQADVEVRSLNQLSEDVARRVRAGDLARADALAAQAEHLAATAQQTDARQRLQAAAARWTVLTGLTASPDLGSTARIDASPIPSEASAQHPERQLADQSVELARKRVTLMRLSRREAPELTVGLRQDTGGRGESTQASLVVELKLPFATDDRNRPLEAEALADLDVAETHALRLRERLDSSVAAAEEAQRSAETQREVQRVRARLLRERATLIDRSFRAGETPLPDLLRALSAAAQADSAVARQNAALGLAHARLQQALGLLP